MVWLKVRLTIRATLRGEMTVAAVPVVLEISEADPAAATDRRREKHVKL
jgi:hypothetical protein